MVATHDWRFYTLLSYLLVSYFSDTRRLAESGTESCFLLGCLNSEAFVSLHISNVHLLLLFDSAGLYI